MKLKERRDAGAAASMWVGAVRGRRENLSKQLWLPVRRSWQGVRAGLAMAAIAFVYLAAASAAGAAAYEPNDNISQPFGPLLGGTFYTAALETSNDQDWYRFYTSGQRQFDIAASLFDCPPNEAGERNCANLYVQLLDANGNEVDNGFVAPPGQETQHITHTSPGRREYLLHVSGDQGNVYRLRVDPADALTSARPPAPGANGRCASVRRARSRAATRVRRARRALRRATTRRSRARGRSHLRRRNRELKRARRRVALNC